MREFSIFWDNGGWVVMEKIEGCEAVIVFISATLENALAEVSSRTSFRPVGIKLITKQD